jgi:hypothetical protein
LLITELLVAKDNELKEALKLANEQAQINHKMEALKRDKRPVNPTTSAATEGRRTNSCK